MPTRIGTSNYASLNHANRVYGKHEAQDKIADGSITIGKPRLNLTNHYWLIVMVDTLL
jgi:hypothetical protein